MTSLNQKKCLVCNASFACKPSRAPVRKTCSRACAGIHLSHIHAGRKLWNHREVRPVIQFTCGECGKQKNIFTNRLRHGEGKFCSRSCANKNNAAHGDKNPKWKGGVTPTKKLLRESSEYKAWRKSVFERDDFTCQKCFKRGGEIHADHIKPFAYHPELRLDINNGRTLCVECHRQTPTYGFNNANVIPDYSGHFS